MLNHDVHIRPWQAERTFFNGYTETGEVGQTNYNASVATVVSQLF